MLAGFPFRGDEFNNEPISRSTLEALASIWRWNQWHPYVENWTIALKALRQLWETGKVSELKSPYYEPLKKPKAGGSEK